MAKQKTVQFPIYLTKRKYSALFRKAQKECKSPHPVHDVLDLLAFYYLENTFVMHQKMKLVKPLPEGSAEQKRFQIRTEDLEKKKKIWMKLTKEENQRFTRKVMMEGATKTYIMNLLVDFYLTNEFEIETKIIRVNRK
jgi:hypothetical protein